MLFWRNKIFSALKLLFRNSLYLVLALVLAVALFGTYFVVNDLALFRSAVSINNSLPFLWKVFANQVSMIYQTTGSINVIAVGAAAILGGVNLSLMVLRARRAKVFIGRSGFTSLLGTVSGAFAASCSACSTALVGLFGVSAGLAAFPLRGLEFSLLALGLLLWALYYNSKSLKESGL